MVEKPKQPKQPHAAAPVKAQEGRRPAVSDEVSVEATGETVGEAKWKALRELERLAPGLDKASVRFQVVSEGERGLLGVGYTPARVVASADAGAAPAPAPRADETELEPRVRGIVERVVGAIGARRVDRASRSTDDEVLVTCIGDDLGPADRQARPDDRRAAVRRERDRAGAAGSEKPVTVDAAGLPRPPPRDARGHRARRAPSARCAASASCSSR